MRNSLKIAWLINQHDNEEVKFMNCPGCEKCRLIKHFGKKPESKHERYRKLLDKGADLKLSEIKFLTDKGVSVDDIKRATKQNAYDFRVTMYAIGVFKKPHAGKTKNITAEVVIKTKSQCKSWKEVAAKLEVSTNTLKKLRNKWGL